MSAATKERPETVRLNMHVAPEFDRFLGTLAERMGGTPGEAILKGLVLLEIALDARRDGKRLVVVDDRDDSEEDATEV